MRAQYGFEELNVNRTYGLLAGTRKPRPWRLSLKLKFVRFAVIAVRGVEYFSFTGHKELAVLLDW